jgi:hypothetical protein
MLSFAAYEAGVLRGLLQSLPASETAYDVVTGISAGSTLTAAFSVFAIGDEQSVVDFALAIISDLNQSAIFRQWPGGVVEGFMYHSSLFDSTPLRRLFEEVLSDKTLSPDRVTCMGVSNLRTGLFERFCEHSSIEEVVNVTIASAAIPGVFLDQTIEGETYVDGGTLVNVDVIGAVEQCLALGYPQQDIIVDTIECGGVNMTELSGDLSTLTVLPILLRAATMGSYADRERDYVAAVHAYPLVDFRFRIHPTQDIPGSGIDFNATQMIWMEELGTSDAHSAVAPPQKTNKITMRE